MITFGGDPSFWINEEFEFDYCGGSNKCGLRLAFRKTRKR